jgi:hypothetical protein
MNPKEEFKRYCVMQINSGDIVYKGGSLHRAAVAWRVGTVLGQGSMQFEALTNAIEQRSLHISNKDKAYVPVLSFGGHGSFSSKEKKGSN